MLFTVTWSEGDIDCPFSTLIIEIVYMFHVGMCPYRDDFFSRLVKGILNLLQKVNCLKMALFLLQFFCIDDLIFNMFLGRV